jgi:hypothetical protein
VDVSTDARAPRAGIESMVAGWSDDNSTAAADDPTDRRAHKKS